MDEVRDLVDRCLAGDQTAMFDLVSQYQGQVFGLCFHMLAHRQDAEDMAQESFARALGSLKNYDRDRGFLPWLLAIAGNRCRTLLASRARRPRACALSEETEGASDGRQAADNLAEEMQLALDGLREEYRKAFLLFHEQQLSYAAIGEALGCPVGTVKTWVHRARLEMIAQLGRRGVFEESRNAVRAV